VNPAPGAEDAGAFERPGSPWRALTADAVLAAHRGAVQAVALALGHVLRQQAWARDRLRMHAGAVVRVGLVVPEQPGLPAPEARLMITPEGLIEPAEGTAPPRATLLLQPSAQALKAFATQGVNGLTRHLRVDGDVMLAAALGELARDLRWDVEEDLSRLVGDVAAHRAAGLLDGLVHRLKNLPAVLAGAAANGDAPGAGPAVSRAAMRGLGEALGALDDRLRRLEARADRLS
jgi:ubiquinone biosynthesis protein UbiJ